MFWQKFAKIRYFEFFSVIFAQILMTFYRNFANILEKINVDFFDFLAKSRELGNNSDRTPI